MDAVDHSRVERARAGDVDAFAELVTKHQASVHACAFAVTLRAELAEDLCQEAFLIAWQSLSDLRDPSAFGPWVGGIARNLGKRALRVRDRETDLDVESAPSESDPEQAVRHSEYRTVLAEALSTLSLADLETLALFYGEHGSIRAVAEAGGISEQVAQKRVSRARQGLSTSVEKQLAGAARRRRTAAAVASAVVALIHAGPASAAAAEAASIVQPTSSGAVAMTMLKFAIPLILLTGAGAVAWTASRSPDAPRSSEPTRVEPGVTEVARGSSRPQLATPSGASTTDTIAAPASYRLTQVDDSMVAVDLAGGVSGLYRPDSAPGRPGPVTRRIRGRVVSPTGKVKDTTRSSPRRDRCPIACASCLPHMAARPPSTGAVTSTAPCSGTT